MFECRNLVLIADNDQAVRDALQFALQLEGFCVHAYCGGAGLLQDPDLPRARCVILNERMKPMDGFALLDALQARNVAVPSILLTSHATAVLRERASRVGVTDVLEKPILDNALLDSIWQIVGHAAPATGIAAGDADFLQPRVRYVESRRS